MVKKKYKVLTNSDIKKLYHLQQQMRGKLTSDVELRECLSKKNKVMKDILSNQDDYNKVKSLEIEYKLLDKQIKVLKNVKMVSLK